MAANNGKKNLLICIIGTLVVSIFFFYHKCSVDLCGI